MHARFIVFEGPDRAGKSTQARLLAARLRRAGRSVLLVREPGSTPLGERIRHLLLRRRSDLDARAELFLYMASRAQLVAQRIQPALRHGRIVVCDRYVYSSIAYQGAGGGLGMNRVEAIGALATQGLVPDRVVFLDLDPRTAFARGPRRRDRIEARSSRYHRRVRRAFRSIARALGRRALVVDARAPAREIHERIWTWLSR